MASYRGERFITAQIDSVLEQLSSTDELIIVDDASPDNTVGVIQRRQDPRIRLFMLSENVGYVRAFERALTEATGDVLLLADQDDVWAAGRVDALCAALEHADVVASNLNLWDSTAGAERATGTPIAGPLGIREWKLPRVGRQTPIRNTLGVLAGVMPYFGCAMGVRRSFLQVVAPFPEWLYESHDLWIGLCGNLAGKMEHISAVSTFRRLHDANTSPSRPRSLTQVVRSRVLVARMVVTALTRRGAGRASTSQTEVH